MKHLRLVILIGIVLLSFQACQLSPSTVPSIVEEEVYPQIVISDSFSLDTTFSLYKLSPDFIEHFIDNANNYEGTQIIMRVPFPEQWGLIGVESMPQGREVWLVQSQNREWTYLVITSGSGTQRILDAVPIGLDLAEEDQNSIEREVWTWHRDEEGAFVVDKVYEWKKSIVDATVENAADYIKTSYAQDKYVVGEMGRFECYPQHTNDSLQYQVVVFYRGASLPSEWEDKTEYIEAFCEDYGVYYANVSQDYHQVLIQDYKSNDVVTLDISPYICADSVGMILFENGKAPQHIPFRSIAYLEMEIKKYFNKKNQL